MLSVANFVAEVAEPPLPLIVPLAHTPFPKPILPKLLQHEDLGGSPSPPPRASAPKASALKASEPKASAPFKTVSFARSSSPDLEDLEDLTLSKFSLQIPIGGPSHIKDSDFPMLTGWTPAFIKEFHGAVEVLIAQKFDPKYSLNDQDPKARAEVVTEILSMYPVLNNFVDHWPLEKVLIRACKNSAAKEKTGRNLRSRTKHH